MDKNTTAPSSKGSPIECSDTSCLPDQTTSLNNIAVCYYEQGLFQKAETNLNRALRSANLPRSRSSLCVYCKGECRITSDLSTLIPNGIGTELQNESTLDDLTESFPSNTDGMELAFPNLVKINQSQDQEHNENSTFSKIMVILFNLAKICQQTSKFSDANKWYKQALHVYFSIGDELDDTQKMIPMAIFHSMGLFEYIQRRYHNAMLLYTKALSYCQSKLNDKKLLVAATLHGMGVIQCHDPSGDKEASLKYFREALRIRRMVLGDNHEDIAYTCISIGKLHAKMEQYDKAMMDYDKTRRIRMLLLGNDHVDIAEVIFCIGQIHDFIGDTEMALTLCSSVLNIVKVKLGVNHLNTITVMNYIADLHCQMEDIDKSLQLMQEILQVKKTIYDDCHSEIAMTLNKLGNLHLLKEDYSIALDTFQQCFSIKESCHSRKNPGNVTSQIDIAHRYARCGQFTEAKQLYIAALSLMEPTNIMSRRNVAYLLAKFAHILYQKQDYKQALRTYQEWYNVLPCLDATCQEYVEEANKLTDIGLALKNEYVNENNYSNFDLAIKAHKLSLHIQRSIKSPHDKGNLIVSLYELATIYEQEGDYEKTLDYYQQTLQLEEEIKGKDHQDVAITWHCLGEVQLKMGELDEALRCFKCSVQIELDHDDTDTLSVVKTMLSICDIYQVKGEVGKAMEVYTKASRIYQKVDMEIEHIFLCNHMFYMLALKYPKPSPAA